jgi:hypothetical protein
MTDYKQLAEELYEMLKEIRDVINLFQVPPVLDSKIDRIDNFLHKYEGATNRGTGRTTILYHKAITEALENPGKSVEFIDHYPHNNPKHHAHNLVNIIDKLGLDIVVSVPAGTGRVFLYNRFER